MHPKDGEGIAKSIDADQMLQSGSALFAQTCLSKNLGKLWYPYYYCEKLMNNNI